MVPSRNVYHADFDFVALCRSDSVQDKKCSFGLFIAAAAVIFPAAVFSLLDNELLPKLAYTLPFFLYIAAAVTAKADKKIQIKEFKIKYPIKKEV